MIRSQDIRFFVIGFFDASNWTLRAIQHDIASICTTYIVVIVSFAKYKPSPTDYKARIAVDSFEAK